jgi:hypothetical protein
VGESCEACSARNVRSCAVTFFAVIDRDPDSPLRRSRLVDARPDRGRRRSLDPESRRRLLVSVLLDRVVAIGGLLLGSTA